jgi:hypothetical protein
MKVNMVGRIEYVGEHLEQCYHRAGIEPPEHFESEKPLIGQDMTKKMSASVATLAQEMRKRPNKIWEKVNKEFIEEGGNNYQGLRKDQVTKMVYNERAEEAGIDAIRKVELNYSRPSRMAFLRHYSMFTHKEKIQRMLCFAVPELLILLSCMGVSTFVLFWLYLHLLR